MSCDVNVTSSSSERSKLSLTRSLLLTRSVRASIRLHKNPRNLDAVWSGTVEQSIPSSQARLHSVNGRESISMCLRTERSIKRSSVMRVGSEINNGMFLRAIHPDERSMTRHDTRQMYENSYRSGSSYAASPAWIVTGLIFSKRHLPRSTAQWARSGDAILSSLPSLDRLHANMNASPLDIVIGHEGKVDRLWKPSSGPLFICGSGLGQPLRSRLCLLFVTCLEKWYRSHPEDNHDSL